MTKFIDTTKKEKESKATVFTHYLSGSFGWAKTTVNPNKLKEVKYLGYCGYNGDMFAAYHQSVIYIFKGTKGDEFE